MGYRFSGALLMSVIGIIGASGQAPASAPLSVTDPGPAASPVAANAKPLRRLEYRFSVDQTGMHGGQSNVGYHLGTGATLGTSNDGRDGTLMLDVMSASPDGGLVVRVQERVDRVARPDQPYTCAVYPDTTVVCSPYEPVTDAEWVILRYVGRRFFEPAKVQNGGWSHSVDGRLFSVDSNFKVSDPNATPVVIDETRITAWHAGTRKHEDITITYDPKMEIPVAVREDGQTTGSGSSSQTKMQFTLTKDSFAKQG